MAGKMLSGAELFSSIQPADIGLPQRGGQKHYCPDDTWLHEKQLQLFRRERRDVLLEERIGKDGSLNKGEWRPDIEKVELLKERGKVWEHIGHVHHGKKLLFPEEAMFLVDQGQMELQYGGVTLSVQEAFSTLLARRIPLLHYQVYAHLSRAGYILRRHDTDLIVTGYEKKLRMDHHRSGSRKNRRRRKREQEEEQFTESDIADAKVNRMEVESDEQFDMDTSPEETNASLETWIHGNSEGPSKADDSKPICDIPHSTWNFSELNFPEFNAKSGEVVLRKPAENFLPKGTAWPVNLDQENDQSVLKLSMISNPVPKSYQDALEFSHGGSIWKKSTKARNWKELKLEKAQKIKDNKMGLTPATHLWEDSVTPLLKPHEAVSTGCILDNIKIIKNVHLPKETGEQRESEPKSEAAIVYDIYLPNKKFRKSDPGPPHFRTCIVSAQDEFPSPACLFGTMKKCMDGVPLLWAIVDNGDIAFYCFHDVDIPQDIVMG